MRWFRKAALTGVVWATAAMTLVAGTPHFVCRCANGAIKPFCLGLVSPATGSCCGGCPGKACDAGNTSKPSCCCHKAHARKATDAVGPQVQRQGCTRTLAQAALLVAPDDRPTTVKHLASDLAPAAGPVLIAAITSPASYRMVWQTDRLPPPTDLVVSLQRLTI